MYKKLSRRRLAGTSASERLAPATVCVFCCLFVGLFVCLSVCLFDCLIVCLFVCLFVFLLACLFCLPERQATPWQQTLGGRLLPGCRLATTPPNRCHSAGWPPARQATLAKLLAGHHSRPAIAKLPAGHHATLGKRLAASNASVACDATFSLCVVFVYPSLYYLGPLQ